MLFRKLNETLREKMERQTEFALREREFAKVEVVHSEEMRRKIEEMERLFSEKHSFCEGAKFPFCCSFIAIIQFSPNSTK